MSLTKEGTLYPCTMHTNCVLVSWEFNNCNQAFEDIINIATSLPRTEVLERTNNYWHGVCRSLIFRFPDDLEILNLANSGIIQLRSASRYGASDLGVNSNRIKTIYSKIKF